MYQVRGIKFVEEPISTNWLLNSIEIPISGINYGYSSIEQESYLIFVLMKPTVFPPYKFSFYASFTKKT